MDAPAFRSLTALTVAVAASLTLAAGAHAAPARCTITGTNGDDVLHGTPGRDVICGRGGDDVIYGGKGDDILRGGPGNDRIFGGLGDDRLEGGSGVNDLDAQPGIVGDGPPCGPGAPVDCRFDLTIKELNNPSDGTYGIGTAWTGTTEYSGNDGFNYPGLQGHPITLVWTGQSDGSVDDRIRVDKVDSAVDGSSPGRGSAIFNAVVRTSAWKPGERWVTRGTGAPGTADGPLYIDVESHQPLIPVGAPVEYNVHIYGWVHLANDHRG